MRRCPECNIEIGDPVSRCPLCGAKLEVTGDEQTGAFLYPAFSEHDKPRSSFPFLAKLFSFLSLITVGVCTLIDLLIAHRLTWSLYVTGAVIMLWGTVGLHLLAKINLNNMLLNDVCAVSLYLILVDHLSGWGRWSIDYVIPILYIGIMITTVILAVIFKVYWREYILSLVVVCILGIGPLLIFLNSRSPIRFLCLAAALLAAALAVGLLFFAGGKLFSEWRRRMNI